MPSPRHPVPPNNAGHRLTPRQRYQSSPRQSFAAAPGYFHRSIAGVARPSAIRGPRRHGVARGLLTAWRRQLLSDGSSQEPQQSFAAVKIDTVASVSNDAPRYSAEPDAVATALPAVTGRGRIEIDVAGARIRVENGVDQVTLSMVLAAVRGDH